MNWDFILSWEFIPALAQFLLILWAGVAAPLALIHVMILPAVKE